GSRRNCLPSNPATGQFFIGMLVRLRRNRDCFLLRIPHFEYVEQNVCVSREMSEFVLRPAWIIFFMPRRMASLGLVLLFHDRIKARLFMTVSSARLRVMEEPGATELPSQNICRVVDSVCGVIACAHPCTQPILRRPDDNASALGDA